MRLKNAKMVQQMNLIRRNGDLWRFARHFIFILFHFIFLFKNKFLIFFGDPFGGVFHVSLGILRVFGII